MTYFPVHLSLRIDWSEMDLFGHVNNVAFFKYIQAARVNYWELSGMSKLFEEQKIGPILASSGCEFRKPLYYPGTITLCTGMEFIKETSFGLMHQILNDQGEVAAEAKDVIVMFDFKSKTKVLFPDGVRKRVEELEGKRFV